MNNPISKNHKHLLEHTLGGPDPKKWFRNHFVASDGHTDLPALRELEDLGLMKEVPAPTFCPDSIVFVVTDEGKEELKKKPSNKL